MTPKPLDLGTLFDVLALRHSPTRVELSRPLDIAPGAGTGWDMAGLAGLVAETAGCLWAAGARPGDRIAVLKPNHWDYVLLACAAARLGAVPALLSATLPAAAIQLMLKRLRPALLVSTAKLLAAGDLAASARRVVSLDAPLAGAVPFDDLRGHEPPGPCRRSDDDPLIIHHTSGTTGVPKLVLHTTATIIRRLAGFEAVRWPVLASRRDDTVATAVPFSHGRAVPWTASVGWLAPRRMLLLADPEPAAAGPALRAHPPTVLEAAPASYVGWRGLAASTDSPFRAVRLYVSTFDAVHPPTVRTFLAASRRRAPLWMEGWGQTETGPLTFRFLTRRSMLARGRRHPTTRNLGRPVPTRTRLRVVDPRTMAPLPVGQVGLVQTRTAALCAGYVGEEDRWTAKLADGWWNTGDLGALSRTGALLVTDREIDHVPGLSCLELEDVLADRLPAVAECTVLGVPGDLPVPVLVLADGQPGPDARTWRSVVADLPVLAPPVVLAAADLPRTGTGKVRRADLRERLTGRAATYSGGRWT